MSVMAKSRATLAIRGTTNLDPAAVLGLIKSSTDAVKGGGSSLLTSGISNLGAKVHLERESETKLWLSINSGKRLLELCTFTAEVTEDSGRTRLRVGGLDSYKTSQSKFFVVVPAGPKAIHGLDIYKRYLDAVASAIRSSDPQASLTVAQAPS